MMPHDPLLEIPAHILTHITGDRRKHLLEYLLRWEQPAVALRYLEHWLDLQPQLATLREASARVQIELGRAQSALELVDDIDAERGATETRRGLRLRALGALGDWSAAHALLPAQPHDASGWRLHAELLTRQGEYAQASAAYARASALMPADSPPLRGLAELALAQADLTGARALLLRRIAHNPAAPADTRDLQLLREIAERLVDTSALAKLEAQLREQRAAEQRWICADIGFDPNAQAEAATPEPSSAPVVPPAAAEPVLPDQVWEALREHFGYTSFRPGQAAVVDHVLRDSSVLAVLPTGAGKSLTYQLPALTLPGATLVISPLIALMKDQIDNLPPALAERATTINSALDGAEIAARLRGVAEGRFKLIYVAPERLRQQPFVHALRRAGLARVVVDEAHCVSLWGISFRPDYLFLQRAFEQLGSPPLLALTATATPDTEIEIKAHLAAPNRAAADAAPIGKGQHDRALATIRTSIFRPNLHFEVAHVANRQAKLEAVAALCKTIDGPVVVYVRSRDGCEEVAGFLRQRGVVAEHYHAQVGDRSGVQDRFMRGNTRVLVATVAFGMGVDKADVRAIIHYNLPQSIEAYYQEAGRAGRDGLPARCVLLYAAADKGQLTSWLREEALTKQYLRDVYRWLRQQIGGTWGIISPDQLKRDLREQDESRMRVALGLLERVGMLTRHFDLPRSATITLRDLPNDDPDFAAFVQAAQLQLGQSLDVDLIALAEQTGYAPDELERWLLYWQDLRLVRYEGSARDVLLELRAAPPDVGRQIDALLAEYSARQDARIEAIAAYARGVTCRHRVIAAHFGERLPPCRSACDICTPATTARGHARPERRGSASHAPTLRYALVQEAILQAVGELPGQLNDKELVCVLLGEPGYPSCAAFGRLAGAEFLATRQAIGALVAAGRLAYRNRTLVPADPATRSSAPAAVEETILRCLTELPFPVGKSGLAKILKGAAGSPVGPERCSEYAALNSMTGAAIEGEIERLVEQGRLRRSSGPRPVLALGQS